MHRIRLHRLAACLALTTCAACAGPLDHREFDATLHAPYAAEKTAGDTEARSFTMAFSYPHVETAQDISWRLALIGPAGQEVRRWEGVERLLERPLTVTVRWPGRVGGALLPDGVYRVRLQASARPAGPRADPSGEAIDQAFEQAGDELVEQAWDIAVGPRTPPALPPFSPLPTGAAGDAPGAAGMLAAPHAAPAPAALPYTVYYGNLHSQTNHSDGGGALATCTGAQTPQTGVGSPADAYAYAREHGLDILMASEHNHMYDGSDGTNTAADPAAARALYQSGLAAAAGFSASHPGFLALYGLEWGVITNGGHMNIFNSPALLEWERNAGGQLIGDTLTPKSDYAALYTVMRQRRWVGQFNHPALNGQFLVNGVALGYTADGDQAMALCEVLNSSAFSANTTETETRRSNYEAACDKALEAGYHLAFSSDQDNHCANWGASYSNRTGVLIPNGVALSQASFLEAVRARRVFATMDKNAQLVLTANGHIMGERFANSGLLTLTVNFASGDGQTVSTVELMEGVPGRNGTVSVLAASATASVTPSVGEHFYYARLTQSDGKILWSAPVWVTQSVTGGAGAAVATPGKQGKPGREGRSG